MMAPFKLNLIYMKVVVLKKQYFVCIPLANLLLDIETS